MAEPSKTRRRKEARPGEITAAAISLFHSKGFAATKLDDVAAAAGVTKGTVYLYFASKEELFKAVVREHVLPNLSRTEDAVAASSGSAAAQLRIALLQFVDGLNRCNGSISKLMIAESGNFPELGEFYVTEVVYRGHELIRNILRRGIELGEFRSMDLTHIPAVILSPIVLANIWKHSALPLAETTHDLAKYAQIQLDLILNGLMAK
jgi:AcrR family transcriptional regulator